MKNNSTINIDRYCKEDMEINNINLSLENLYKLDERISHLENSFNANFVFSRESGSNIVSFDFSGYVYLICQNTLKPFKYEISTQNKVAIASDDRLVKNKNIDIHLCDTDTLNLKNIIQEELLLDIPLCPKKESFTCKNTEKVLNYGNREHFSDKSPKKDNPFSILKQLKSKS